MSEITLTLTEPEAQNLVAVVDAGVRASGLQSVRPIAPILEKLDAAIAAKQKDDEDGDA